MQGRVVSGFVELTLINTDRRFCMVKFLAVAAASAFDSAAAAFAVAAAAFLSLAAASACEARATERVASSNEA